MSAISPPIARRSSRTPARATTRRSARAAQVSVETTQVTPRKRVTPVRAGVFGVFVGVILLLGLIALLVINTSLAQGAFRVSELTKQATELTQQRQALEKQLAQQQMPAVLEQRARAMGMVPHSVPVFLRLSDGAILGKAIPQVAQAQPVTDPNSTTPMGQLTPGQWTPWIEPGVAP